MSKALKQILSTIPIIVIFLLPGCIRRANTANTPSPTQVPSLVSSPHSIVSPFPQRSPTTLPIPNQVLSGCNAPVTHIVWSPDSSILASACGDFDSTDFTVRLWHADGSPVTGLTGHTEPVTALAWSPDGNTLASGSLDGTIRLWHAGGDLIRVLEGHAGHVFALAWSPDGKTLASGSMVTHLDPSVQLWDPGGRILKTLSTSFSGGKFYNLAWSPDGNFIVGGATDYKLWRADGTQVFWLERSEHSTPAWGMAWSPDSQHWAVGDENGTLAIYDIQGRRVTWVQDHSGILSLAWSPDSLQIASSKTLWHLDGSRVKTLSAQPEYVNSLDWSPKKVYGSIAFASGGSDGIVHLWSTDGEHLATLRGHTASIRAVAWSPDGKTLASASDDKTIRLWDLTLVSPTSH